MNFIRVCLAAIFLCIAVTGCKGSEAQSGSRSIGATYASAGSYFDEYRVGPADVLSIYVWQQTDLNRTVTVRPDGMISFPLLGDIYVVGMTPQQIQNVMVQNLKKYIEILPEELSVGVEEIHSYAVSVLGKVNAPGRFEFQTPVTVLDALAQAGGMTEFANSSDILIIRNEKGVVKKIRFDYRDALSKKSKAAQLNVYPGDTILVP